MPKTYDGTRIKVKADLHKWWAGRLTARIKAEEVSNTFEELHSLIIRRDTIYSYGTHFPMATVFRHEGGAARFVLINGDSWTGASGWGNGTGYDQGIVRRNVQKSEIPYAVIPFSALDAAGLDRASLKVIESRPERHTFHERVSNDRPGSPIRIPDPGGAMALAYDHRFGHYLPTGDEHEGLDVGEACASTADGAHHGTFYVTREVPLLVDSTDKAQAPREAHGWPEGNAELKYDGKWHWTIRRHWLGDALIRARSTETRYRKPTAAESAQWDAANVWQQIHFRLREGYHAALNLRVYAAHALREGKEELYDARTRETWVVSQKLVDDTAVECDHAHALLDDHDRDRVDYPNVRFLTDGSRVQYTITRWAYYLSSFDYNEPGVAPYFMCELPAYVHRDGQRYAIKPATIDEAIDWLRPDAVVQAQRAGLDVLRQGDIFAIPTAYTTDELIERGHPKLMHNGHGIVQILMKGRGDRAEVHGTNHQPTHAIVTTDGEWYGRGRLYHVPQGWGRTPDHRVVELGDRETWYRLVKNTVPLDKATGSSRGSITASGATVNQSGQSRAWMLGGGVD